MTLALRPGRLDLDPFLAAPDGPAQGEAGTRTAAAGTYALPFFVAGPVRPLAVRAGYAPQVKTLPLRRFDVPANVLDIRKLQTASGWRPRVNFAAGIERVWQAVLESYA